MAETPTSDWTWINAAADRFESACKQGRRPRFEDYLAEVDKSRRVALLEELLRVELELRRRAGFGLIAAVREEMLRTRLDPTRLAAGTPSPVRGTPHMIPGLPQQCTQLSRTASASVGEAHDTRLTCFGSVTVRRERFP
jgi:hypothetical protein